MKIDIFCHIFPQNYYDRMMKLPEVGTTIKKRVPTFRPLWISMCVFA